MATTRPPGPIFGQPLDAVLKKLEPGHPNEKIPYFLAQAFRLIKLYGLAEEGIGRLSGHMEVVESVRDALHAGQEVSLASDAHFRDPHNCMSLVKRFISELPETLIPRRDRHRAWAVNAVPALKAFLQTLPPANFQLLRALVELFHLILLNAHVNRMSIESLVKIIGPNLLPFDSVQEYQATNHVATLLIEHYSELFNERDQLLAELSASSRPLVLQRKLFGHRKSILCMCRSEDGRVVVTGDSSGLVLLWDPDQLRLIDSLDTGRSPVLSLCAAGQNVWAACIEQMHVIDTQNAARRLVRSHAVPAACVARVGHAVWTAGQGPTFRIFNPQTLQLMREVQVPGCGSVVIRTMNVIPTTKTLWAACNDRCIRVFNIETAELLREFKAHAQQIHCIEPLPQPPDAHLPPLVATTSDDKSIRFWHQRDLALVGELNVHSAKVYGVVAVGSKLFSYGWDRHVVVSDLATLRFEQQIEVPHTDAISSMLLLLPPRVPLPTLWSASWDRSVSISIVKYDEPLGNTPATSGNSNTSSPMPVAVTAASPSPTGSPWLQRKPAGVPSAVTGTNFTTSMTPSKTAPPPPPTTTTTTPLAATAPKPSTTVTVTAPPIVVKQPVASVLTTAAVKKSASAALPQVPSWQLDPSEVELATGAQTLGKGTFGTVFKAVVRGKTVAVKKFFAQALDEQAMADFRNEVVIMSSLSHPNLLLFIGACFDPGNLLIVTELMPRGNVEELLYHKDGPPPLLARMRMARDAAQGMTWLHLSRPPFLHLDLKPANLLVDSNGNVKVADFGFALIKRQHWPEGKQPVAKGTPIYAAPEVLLGKSFDEKADVFSFAMVLWEMFTCEFPWANTTTLKDHVRNVAVKNDRPPIPVDCPPTLREAIQFAWQLQPDRRPSFEDMLPRFDFILVESALRDAAAARFWKTHFPEEQRVPQPRFFQALADFVKSNGGSVGCSPDEVAYKCLTAVLADPQGEVSLETFANVVEWFGPFDAHMLSRVVELLRQPHFHGDISAAEAQRVLAGEKRGAWLLRFSSKPGDFSITIKGESGAPVNYRIEKDTVSGGYTFGKTHHPSLDDVLRVYKKDLGLKQSVAGSKYESLFAKRAELISNEPQNAYSMPDLK